MSDTYLSRERHYWLLLIGDFILLAASFLVLFWIRRGHLRFEPMMVKALPLLAGMWLLVTLFSRKFMVLTDRGFFTRLQPFWTAAMIQALLVSLPFYLLGWYGLSRFIIYGTFGLHLILENLVFALYFLWNGREKQRGGTPFPIVFFCAELFAIFASFFFIYYFRKETLRLREDYQLLLLGVVFIWLLVSLLLHKFRIDVQAKLLHALLPFWKSEAVIVSIVSFFIFFTRQVGFSRTVILGSLLVFAVVENLVVLGYFLFTRFRGAPVLDDRETTGEFLRIGAAAPPADKLSEMPSEKYMLPGVQQSSQYLRKKLQRVYLKKFEEIYRFIEESLDLGKFDILTSHFFFARSTWNVRILEDESLTFVFNLENVNEFRRINQMFIEVNRSLKPGGIYIGSFESLQQRKDRIFSRFGLLARLLYPGDFFFRRMMPKIPLLKQAYFFLTRGHKQVLSETECLGRLYYCGFDIIALREIEGCYYFIACKDKEPHTDQRPSYGLLFRQRRVGKGGKIVHIYKLRTMHPYAEYLHRFLLERRDLDETGKISGDFRVTGWGRFFRKTLLDELPMLINFFKGDLKLVGVRPLSESFFAAYPEDLQKERVRYKPGLIPPYYADMPRGIEEVWESERRYLARYGKHKWRTDIAYFFKALNNILFHHAKSK